MFKKLKSLPYFKLSLAAMALFFLYRYSYDLRDTVTSNGIFFAYTIFTIPVGVYTAIIYFIIKEK